eukprot:COSAG02_NODE_5676_length_4138_cov_1.611785_3_plen_82_part_00
MRSRHSHLATLRRSLTASTSTAVGCSARRVATQPRGIIAPRGIIDSVQRGRRGHALTPNACVLRTFGDDSKFNTCAQSGSD